MKHRIATLGLAVLAFSVVTVAAFAGGAGSLDPSFGDRGMVTTATAPGNGDNDYQNGLALTPDGRIVVGGSSDMGTGNGGWNWRISRYSKRGALDPTFGTGGTVLTSIAAGDGFPGGETGTGEQIWELGLQPDGKIVAAGHSDEGPGSGGVNFALGRYNPDGSLDASFGGDGTITTAMAPGNNDDVAFGLALQPNGKIVAAGSSRQDAANSLDGNDFTLARYNANGTLDASFGSGGRVHTDVSGTSTSDTVTDVAVQPDGKIVAAGQVCSSSTSSSCDFAVARYNSNGSLDASFGSGGIVVTPVAPIAHFDTAWDLALQADGKIVAAGTADFGVGAGRLDFALARYNANGSLDSSFGGDGMVTVPIGSGDAREEIFAVAVDSLGRIVAGGYTRTSGPLLDFAVARLNADGSLDSSFGSGGKVVTQASGTGGYDSIYDLAVDKTGKIVAAGECDQPAGGTDVCVVRYKGGEND
jgi:uncharacterized delta-60 repeat protein